MRSLLCIILLFCCSYGKSQTTDVRLPLKVGPKFAIIDANEKEIFPAEFDDVRIHSDLGVLLLNKNGLWGVYSWNGEKILDHVMSASGLSYKNAPQIQKVNNGNSAFSKYVNTGLLAITDQYAKVKYYVNPNKTLQRYKAYAIPKGENTNLFQVDFSKITNIFHVINRDNTINFIDSTGIEILPTSYDEGEIINENIIGLVSNNKTALFNKNKQLTEFEFRKTIQRYNNSLVKMSKEVNLDNGSKKYLYYAFTADGALIDTGQSIHIMDGYVLSNKEKGFVLFKSDGTKIFLHDTYSGNLIKLGSQVFIETKFNYGSGLMSIEGKEIFPPDHNLNFYLKYGKFVTNFSQTSTVYDSLLHPLFSMDMVESVVPNDHPDFFTFTHKDGWRNKYGLVDKNNHILIAPEWHYLLMAPCDSLVHVFNDSIQFVIRANQNTPVLRTSKKWRLNINCSTKTIDLGDGDNNFMQYDFEGIMLDSMNRLEAYENRKNGIHKFKIEGKNKSYFLEDKQGKKVISTSFLDILSIYDKTKKESVYICQHIDNFHPTTKVYNDELKIITPVGYSVPNNWKQYNNINPGTLIVANDADVAKNRYNYKIGICDYDGKWLVKPFFGTVKYFEKGLFILHDYNERKVKFCDAQGNKTCDQDFFMVEKGHGSDFFQNRILVGNIVDPSYLKKVDAMRLGEKEADEAIKLLEALGEPEMVYGYLNKLGKMVLDMQYRQAKPFPMQGIKTCVTVLKNGKLFSQVIDTTGKVYLEVEYDDLDILDEHHYKGKQGGLWAILSDKGEALTPFQFEEINSNIKGGYFTAKNGENRFIINEDYRVLSLGQWYNTDIQILNNYFVVKCISTEKDSYKTSHVFKIYDKNGIELGLIEDGISVGDIFHRSNLPNGYLAIYSDHGAQNGYIYDVIRKKKLVK